MCPAETAAPGLLSPVSPFPLLRACWQRPPSRPGIPAAAQQARVCRQQRHHQAISRRPLRQFPFSLISGRKAGIIPGEAWAAGVPGGWLHADGAYREPPGVPLVRQPEGLPAGGRRRYFPRNHILSGSSVSGSDLERDAGLTCDLPLPQAPPPWRRAPNLPHTRGSLWTLAQDCPRSLVQDVLE